LLSLVAWVAGHSDETRLGRVTLLSTLTPLSDQGLKLGDPKNPNKRDLYTASLPAPNAYTTTEKIGWRKPAIGFTRDTKEHSPYVSMSREGCDALLRGRLGPGPGYDALPSVGPQHESYKRNSSIIGFTKASRFAKQISEETPGPGSYTT
jgi:hypothetical protein